MAEMKFPNRTTAVGKMIDEYLKSDRAKEAPLDDEVVHLLFAANRWEDRKTIIR